MDGSISLVEGLYPEILPHPDVGIDGEHQVKLLGTEELHHTHQQIADDLHSSRVVISRLLKQLEHRGIVEIHRNRIKVKDY
jgi:CRP-like cAMP-binding protein